MESIYPDSAVSSEKVRQRSAGMSNIRVELDQIETALYSDKTSPETYRQLYAAQQALAWVLNTSAAASPYKVIITGKVQAPTDIPVS